MIVFLLRRWVEIVILCIFICIIIMVFIYADNAVVKQFKKHNVNLLQDIKFSSASSEGFFLKRKIKLNNVIYNNILIIPELFIEFKLTEPKKYILYTNKIKTGKQFGNIVFISDLPNQNILLNLEYAKISQLSKLILTLPKTLKLSSSINSYAVFNFKQKPSFKLLFNQNNDFQKMHYLDKGVNIQYYEYDKIVKESNLTANEILFKYSHKDSTKEFEQINGKINLTNLGLNSDMINYLLNIKNIDSKEYNFGNLSLLGEINLQLKTNFSKDITVPELKLNISEFALLTSLFSAKLTGDFFSYNHDDLPSGTLKIVFSNYNNIIDIISTYYLAIIKMVSRQTAITINYLEIQEAVKILSQNLVKFLVLINNKENYNSNDFTLVIKRNSHSDLYFNEYVLSKFLTLLYSYFVKDSMEQLDILDNFNKILVE